METKKNPPVDRGKLLIGLECCRSYWPEDCVKCPYFEPRCCVEMTDDALAYICYLEERLEEAMGHDA